MKTSDEIKKGLECCYGNEERRFCEMCPFGVKTDDIYPTFECSNFDAVGECALAYIQQLEAQVPKWISVEEQPEPPEDDVYYCYGYWIGSGRKQAETAEYAWGEWKIENNFVLTHWMPLPEPPKEE